MASTDSPAANEPITPKDTPKEALQLEPNNEARASTAEKDYGKINSRLQLAWTSVMKDGDYKTSHTYHAVHVLLLAWSEEFDDMHVKDEVDDLAKVFREIIVASWVDDNDDSRNLLIVYFVGHGRRGKGPGQLVLEGICDPDEKRQELNKIVWNSTERLLGDAQANILQIIDACYAGNLGGDRGSSHIFEYLACAAADARTKCPGPHSFTRALIWALQKLSCTPGRFTTNDLLHKIKDEAPGFPRDQKPSLYKRFGESVERIILEPLGTDHAANPSPERDGPDLSEQDVLILKIMLETIPSDDDVIAFGQGLNDVTKKKHLQISQIIWAGLYPPRKHFLIQKVTGAFSRFKKSPKEDSFEPTSITVEALMEQMEEEVTETVKEDLHEQVHEQVHEEIQHEFESHTTDQRSKLPPQC